MKSTLSYKSILIPLIGIGLLMVLLTPFYFYKRGMKMPFTRTRPNFQVPTEGIQKITLDNGMTILVYPNHTMPKVFLQVAYNVGGYIEQNGERGLAHLIEHMIFKGTEKLSESDINIIARKYGASSNAFTSRDVTAYYFETDKNNWKPFVGILADCMQNARFDEQHLASELKTVIQEMKMYKDDYWDMMFYKIDSLLYPSHHPYHAPLIGYKEDLMNLSADNLKDFYKKHYHPGQATLFVVGDVDVDEVVAYARENFEPIAAGEEREHPLFPQPQTEISTQHTRFYEDIKTEQLGFYWRIPGKRDDDTLGKAAAFLLGSGEGSRLYKRLVDEEQIASSVGVIAQQYFESGSFLILIEPVTGKSDECQRIVKEEIVKAINDGFNDKELEHMTKIQGKRFFQRLQRFDSFAFEWISSYFTTDDEYAVFGKANKFVDIESDDVQKYLEYYIDPFMLNRIEVLPIPESKRNAYLQAKKDEEDLDQKILQKYKRTTPIEAPKYALELDDPAPLEFTFPKPQRHITLENGLTILLKTNKHLPLISVNCKHRHAYFLANSAEGILVDLMMNMLIEASQGFSKEENVDFFEFNGVDYSFSSKGASISLLSDDYQEIFARFLHVLSKPDFQAQALDKLKNIFVDTLVRSTDDTVSVGLRELKCLLYKNHPFGWSYDQAIDSVKQMTLDDIQAFHKAYVSPANMILSIVGDFEIDEMETSLRKIFSAWEKGTEKTISYPETSFTPGKTTDKPMVRDQLVLVLGQPSDIDIYHPDLTPLKILNFIGFHSLGSRIYQLREQTGSFYVAVGGWGAGAGTEKGFDFVGAILNPGKATVVEQEMRQLIDQMGRDGVKQDELDAAKQFYLKTLIDAISTNSSVANIFGTLEAFNLEFDYYDKVLKRAQTIGLNELNRIAEKYFTSKDFARVRVGRI